MEKIISTTDEVANASVAIIPVGDAPVPNTSVAITPVAKAPVPDASAHTHVKCYKCGFVNPADPNKSDLENFKDYALGEGPFLFQVLIYISSTLSYKEFYNNVAALLDELSCKLFGAKYYQNEKLYLEGFAFCSKTTRLGHTRIKILLKHGTWYDKFSSNSFVEFFEKAVREVYVVNLSFIVVFNSLKLSCHDDDFVYFVECHKRTSVVKCLPDKGYQLKNWIMSDKSLISAMSFDNRGCHVGASLKRLVEHQHFYAVTDYNEYKSRYYYFT